MTICECWNINLLINGEFRSLLHAKEVSIDLFLTVRVDTPTNWWYVAPCCLDVYNRECQRVQITLKLHLLIELTVLL